MGMVTLAEQQDQHSQNEGDECVRYDASKGQTQIAIPRDHYKGNCDKHLEVCVSDAVENGQHSDDVSAVAQHYDTECVEIESLEDDSTDTSDAEDDDLADRGWVTDISSIRDQQSQICTPNGLALPTIEAPSFGDVCVKQSTNVHMGNKLFYKNVTIKQFVYSNSTSTEDENSVENGCVGKDQFDRGDGQDHPQGQRENNPVISGAKLSNGSAHPLYPFPRDKGNFRHVNIFRLVFIVET